MKSRILLISAIALLPVACETAGDGENPNFIRVMVSQEKFVDSDAKELALEWFEADSIRLFDTDRQGVTVKTNNFTEKNAPEVFFTDKWTAGSPLYMVRPADDAVTCSDNGVEGVVIASEQHLPLRNKIATVPSMGAVTGNSTAYRATMKNLTGAVAFAMNDSTVASVTITALGGEPLAGTIDVDYAKLEAGEADFWSLSDGAQGSTSVTAVPMEASDAISADMTFYKGTYYANILPQTYSQGLKVVATFLDGKKSEQIITGGEGGLVVPRSGIVSVAKAMDDTLPDEFEVKIDFTGAWPLKEPILAVAKQVQSGSGDKYTYEYTYTNGGSEFSMDLPLYIFGNKGNGYTHTAGSLRMMSKNSRLLIPGIYGRYLKSIKMEVVNTGAKGFEIVSLGWVTLAAGPKDVVVTKPGVLTFPVGDVKTEKNTGYYMRFNVAGSTFISAVTFTYSTSLD